MNFFDLIARIFGRYMGRFKLFLIFGMIAFNLLLTWPALAREWAVISLIDLPAEMIAQDPFEVEFVVLQHGITPMDGLPPKVLARNRKTGATLIFQARPTVDPAYTWSG
jgi:hypothetical protein